MFKGKGYMYINIKFSKVIYRMVVIVFIIYLLVLFS